MLPKLLWFQGLAEAAQVFAMIWEEKGGDASKVSWLVDPTPPEAWVAAGRCGALPTGSALEGRQEVVWEVPRAELIRVIEEAGSSAACTVQASKRQMALPFSGVAASGRWISGLGSQALSS